MVTSIKVEIVVFLRVSGLIVFRLCPRVLFVCMYSVCSTVLFCVAFAGGSLILCYSTRSVGAMECVLSVQPLFLPITTYVHLVAALILYPLEMYQGTN